VGHSDEGLQDPSQQAHRHDDRAAPRPEITGKDGTTWHVQ
jgi:hypothetical protein